MKPSKNSIQFLSSIAKNKIPSHVWFAILSIYNHQVSYTANLIISTLEYVQSMVDTFLMNMMAYSGSADMPKIFHPLIDIAQLICPGFLLNFQGNVTTPTIIILVTLAIYTVLKYCLFGYIVFKSVSQRESEAVLLTLWRWTVRLQGRVIYYFVSSVWIGLYLAASNDRLNVGTIGKTAIMVLAWIFIGIEFLLSFVLLAKFSHPIPMKHAMSAKNQVTEIITVTQKITIQIIIITLNKETADNMAWICSLTALIFSLFRTVYYLTTFPHYKLKTVQYHAGLLIVTLCLNMGFLLQSLVMSIYDQSISLSLWAIEWIILSFLLVLMARNYINRTWTNLIIQKQITNRKLLLHKIIAIKEVLRVNTAPKGKMDGHPLSYLLKKTTAAISDNPADFSTKESFQKVTISYLEACLAKFPSSNLVKLYLGYCYAKKLKKYGIAIKLLKELQHSSLYSTSLTASLLIHALQESIKIDYAGNRSKLDLYAYMKDVTSVAQLKEVIVQQAERQVIFYTECNNTTQNLSKIHSLAQEIDVYKQKIEGRIQRLLETGPDHYLEPVIVYAYYSYVLNHSINQYKRFMKLYNQKSRKYEKVFNAEKLCKENLYHKDTHLLMLSGERKNITSVMYSSRSFLKDLGKDIVGRDIGHIVPEYFRNNVYSSMKFLLEEGNKAHLDHVLNGFHFHLAKGSLAPCNTYMGIHPFFGQELHYLLMIRKIPNADETIMMKENGDILTFTDRVGKRLGLFSLRKKLPANKVMNISMISHDLARINFAFNVVDPYETSESSAKIHSITIKEIAQNSLVEKANKSLRTYIRSSRFDSRKTRLRYPTVHKDLTIEEAKELYSVYTTRGADLELNAVMRDGNHRKKCFTYHCKIERKPFAAEMLKMITLSEEQKGKYSVKNKPIIESTDRPRRDTTLANAEESVPQIESEHLASLSSHLSSETETESESDEYIDTVNMLSETNRLQRISKRRAPVLTSDREGLLSTEQQGTVQTQPIELETHQSPRKTTRNHKHKDTVFHFSSKIDNSFYQSSNGSEKIRKSGGIQLSKEYEDALSLKYYPGFYKTLRVLFYLVTLSVLASQIALKKVVDSDLKALNVRKNVMSMTEIRNYELLTLYKYATSLWMFATGMQNQSSLPPVAQAPAYMLLMKDSLAQLTMSNKNLLVSADALDKANREKMFQNNVQLYDGNSNSVPFGVNLTSFQATDKIIETSFRVISSTQNLSASVSDLEIVIRNVLNGNLLADETTNEILMLSLEELKTEITKSNIAVMIACQSCLTFIFVFFCIIVYKQYQREKLNMLAFAKLDRIEIIKVSKKVEYFKELILNETEFENIDESKFSNFENKEAIRTVIINERNKKNRTARQPDLTGIVRKYQIIPLKMFIAIFLICGLVYLKTSVAQHSIDLLTNNLWEINFADHVRLTVHLSATIAFSFLTQNGTLVRNLDGVQQFHEELALLPGLIEEIPDVLDSDSDDIYDQEIQDILFGNACAYVTSDEPSIPITTYCDTIRKDASKAGVINFLTLFESDMAEFDLMYTASNKTKEALNQLQRTTFNMRVPSMTVIVNLMMVISQRLGNIFGNTINRSQLYNDVTSGFLLAMLVVLWAVIHFRMINSMREAENKFRNVLKMLPARIVVPNFMLKSYLIRTCKGRFDLVKAFTSE